MFVGVSNRTTSLKLQGYSPALRKLAGSQEHTGSLEPLEVYDEATKWPRGLKQVMVNVVKRQVTAITLRRKDPKVPLLPNLIFTVTL